MDSTYGLKFYNIYNSIFDWGIWNTDFYNSNKEAFFDDPSYMHTFYRKWPHHLG